MCNFTNDKGSQVNLVRQNWNHFFIKKSGDPQFKPNTLPTKTNFHWLKGGTKKCVLQCNQSSSSMFQTTS